MQAVSNTCDPNRVTKLVLRHHANFPSPHPVAVLDTFQPASCSKSTDLQPAQKLLENLPSEPLIWLSVPNLCFLKFERIAHTFWQHRSFRLDILLWISLLSQSHLFKVQSQYVLSPFKKTYTLLFTEVYASPYIITVYLMQSLLLHQNNVLCSLSFPPTAPVAWLKLSGKTGPTRDILRW